MTPEAAEIFHLAREMPAERREGFLLGACGGDVALRSEVEALLRADAEVGRFLAAPTALGSAGPDALARRERPGTQLGRYKLLEQIGEGGMGTIWMAEQREPVKRRVALKIIKLGMDTRQVIARFEAERQALAMMDHPHIAKVFDAGTTEAGRPYFVMEYIKGVPILEYCDQEKVDTKARLQLFVSVCQAIQHAHQKGIIHRDIKPANVLVTLHDGVPVPKVIDFGIAKATNSELTQKTLFTQHRQMIGTPAYMSPEQAEMSGLDIDTRSDIYSLGVLLYELLTGTTPFDVEELLSLGFSEMMRVIRESEPQKPSTRISTLGDTGARTAQLRRVDLKRLGALLRGDLDWIVMKCLEKDRTRRYETANGLAADIGRHLRDEPVTARAPSASYRLRKFVTRNRAQVVAAGLVLGALLAGTLGTAWGLVQESRARSADLQRQLQDEQREAADEARLGRNAEAVAALLAQAEEALEGGDAAKAKVALDAARKRSAEGGADPQAERLERLLADQVLLGELDAVDQLRWSWEAERFAEWTDVAARTRAALERFGCDPDTVPIETAAARIRASRIGERVLAALDRLLLRERTASVRDLLRRVDPDPYRSAVRQAIQAGEWRTLVALAEQDEALDQPPFFSAFLGENGTIPAARRRELLHAAVIRRSSDASLLMALGTLSNSMDDPVERIRWFQAAVAADPDNVAALNDLGMGLFQRGARAESIAYVERAVALDPQMATALCNLGSRHLEDGRLDEALECFERVVEARPEYAHGHLLLGNGRAAEGDLDEAVACYRRALVLDHDKRSALINLTVALTRSGRLDEAVASGRRAVELLPEDADARIVLSEALRAQGRAAEALDPARKAVELDPSHIRAHISLGVLLCDHLSDFDGALACFERAHELDPELPSPIVNMGCALSGKGELEAALARFRQALEVDPRHCWARVSMAVALGESAAGSSEPEEQARLWRQTLATLREALTLYTERAQRGGPAELAAVKADLEMMRHPDVEVLRDPGSWAVLPAEERSAFARLWADLDAFSERIGVRASRSAGGDGPSSEGPSSDGPTTDGPGADDFEATRSFLRQSLDRREAELGPDHRSTLELRLRLAKECISAGDFEQAVPLLEEALARARARFGVEDQLTIGCMIQLATASYRTGRLDRSIPLFEEVLPLQKAMLGKDHPMILVLAANLGVNYRDAGRLEEAISLLEEARRAAGDDPSLSWVVMALFEACARLDPASACEHLDPLIPELEADYGEDHFITLLAMNNLGYFLARARRFDDAEAVLEGTIEREARSLGEGNALLLQTRTNLGELYLLREQHARAEALLRRCLTEQSAAKPDGFRLAMTRSLLGRALAEQQKHSEAEPLLLAAGQWLLAHPSEILSWGSYILPDTLGWLEELYQDWGRPTEAETWREARAANVASSPDPSEGSGG